MTATLTAKPLPKFFDAEVPLAVSIAPPASRLVVVEAWAWRDAEVGGWEAGHEVHDVLAIQAELSARFSRPRVGKRPRCPPSVAAADREGWGFDISDTGYELLILHEEYGGLCPASVLDGLNVVWKAVAAPWPAAEDETRLSAVVTELRSKAFAKAVDAEKRYGVPAAPGPPPEARR
jgi:hypothetical protein